MTDELDGRLEHALRGLAEPASTDGVYERVASRHAHRRVARRARTVGGGLLAVVALAGGVVWAVGRDDPATVATGGGSGSARVVQGAASGRDLTTSGRVVELRALPLPPDAGYVRSPVLSTGSIVQAATYERTGDGYTFPPSHVLRIRESGGRVLDRVDLQGEILSLADGEGARWALTRDKVVTGPDDPEFRIKRLGPDGSVVSNAVPPGSVPAGEVAAAGGGVWLPVRDGVLRFDPVSGAFAAHIPLDVPADQRGIANLGKFVAVTDGTTVRRLDPSTDASIDEHGIVDDDLTALIGLAHDGEAQWLLGRRSSGGVNVYRTGPGAPAQSTLVRIPDEVDARALRSANGVTWLDGTRDGRAIALVLAPRRMPVAVARTVVLPLGHDVEVTFLDRDRAVIAADGRLRIARL